MDFNQIKKMGLRLNRRPFYTFTLGGSPTKSYPLPYDILALAQLEFLLYGYVVATYASGTPVAKYGSVMHSLIETINVQRGSDSFKSASPEMLAFENMLINGTPNVIRATGSATATNDPQTDVTTVPYGTTAQYQNFQEGLTLHFGYPHTKDMGEYFATMFRTTNVSSANVQIIQKNFLNIRDDKNTAPVIYSGEQLFLQINIVEYVGAGAEALPMLYDYRQEELTASYASKTKDSIRIPRLGALSSVLISTRDGASGSATTATAKVFNDNVITNVKLVKNQNNLVDSNFKDLKNQMKSLFGYQAPKVAGIARDDGLSGIFFTKNGFTDLEDITPESATACDLKIETNDPAYVTYTEGCFTRILVNQVAAIKK